MSTFPIDQTGKTKFNYNKTRQTDTQLTSSIGLKHPSQLGRIGGLLKPVSAVIDSNGLCGFSVNRGSNSDSISKSGGGSRMGVELVTGGGGSLLNRASHSGCQY